MDTPTAVGIQEPRDFIFAMMPNHEFTDETVTLREAGLCPRGALFLKKSGASPVWNLRAEGATGSP